MTKTPLKWEFLFTFSGFSRTLMDMDDEYDRTEQASESPPGDDLQNVIDLDESRLYAALCYLPFLVVAAFLLRREDPFVNWHIRQGLFVLAAIVVSLIAAAWVPLVGSLLFLLLFIADVVALVMAMQGRQWKIPGIGTLADNVRL